MRRKIHILAIFLIPFLIFTLLIHMGLAYNERVHGYDPSRMKLAPNALFCGYDWERERQDFSLIDIENINVYIYNLSEMELVLDPRFRGNDWERQLLLPIHTTSIYA